MLFLSPNYLLWKNASSIDRLRGARELKMEKDLLTDVPSCPTTAGKTRWQIKTLSQSLCRDFNLISDKPLDTVESEMVERDVF